MKLKAGETCNIFTYANLEIEWFAKNFTKRNPKLESRMRDENTC